MQYELNITPADENTSDNNYTNYEFQPLQVFYNVVKTIICNFKILYKDV